MNFNLEYLESEIIDQYLYDNNPDRPWIIGYSGGKDSTMVLQLVWYALKKIDPILRRRKIYVVCNDTLVENPKIKNYLDIVLKEIQKSASEESLPLEVVVTKPLMKDTFWVNLIGKGYPAPNNFFRWCTERLKINPTTKFIKDKVGEFGQAVILLGTRYDESSTRSGSMKRHEVKGQRLTKHNIKNVYIYSPIKNLKASEVWQYLLGISSPWGDNKSLFNLYKDANEGECPFQVDTSQKSCGNSRFGCWVCTVVKNDKSMEGMFYSGELWLEKLLKFRNLLATSRNDLSWRKPIRRNKTEGPGPYWEEKRAFLLKDLLMIQKELFQDRIGVELITHKELVAIQIEWFKDGFFDIKVSDIYNRVFNKGIDMSCHQEKIRKEEELLKKACSENPEDFEIINDLLDLIKSQSLKNSRRGLQDNLETAIEKFTSQTEGER